MTFVNRAKKLAIHLGGDDVAALLARQNLTGLPAPIRQIANGALGYLGGQAMSTEGNLLFFTGVPIQGPDEKDFTDAEAAVRLFAQYDGAFAGVFWDATNQVLVVASDRLGMQPLYMCQAGDEIKLVSETKAIIGEPDMAAWGAFISIGHPIGDRSLMHGLERVPPASILVYDCKRRSLSTRRYWDWPEPSDAWRNYDFIGALEEEVRAYAALSDSALLLLSGGFDSRLLLFMLERANLPVRSLTVSHDDEHGDADGRLASQIAEKTGAAHQFVRPPLDFFSSPEYVDYLKASDVGFPSLDLFIAKVAAQIKHGAMWDGLVPGALFVNLHQPEGGFDAYRAQEIRGAGSGIWNAARLLFRPEVVEEMLQGFALDLDNLIDNLPQDDSGLLRFVFQNRTRNRASMNPLKVYSNQSMAYTPGLSKDLFSHAISIPFEEKQHARFYLDLFSRLDKRALSVPFLSGADLIKTGSFSPAYYRERARIEFNSYRARHPRLFGFAGRAASERRARRSVFLDERLFAGDDQWLRPDFAKNLGQAGARNELAWKLLFHWKAWRAVHGYGLDQFLGRKPIGGKLK